MKITKIQILRPNYKGLEPCVLMVVDYQGARGNMRAAVGIPFHHECERTTAGEVDRGEARARATSSFHNGALLDRVIDQSIRTIRDGILRLCCQKDERSSPTAITTHHPPPTCNLTKRGHDISGAPEFSFRSRQCCPDDITSSLLC